MLRLSDYEPRNYAGEPGSKLDPPPFPLVDGGSAENTTAASASRTQHTLQALAIAI